MKEATKFERDAAAKDDETIMAALNKYAAETNKLKIVELTAEQNKNGKNYVSCLSTIL